MKLAIIHNGIITQVLDEDDDLLDYDLDKAAARNDIVNQIERAIVIAKEGK